MTVNDDLEKLIENLPFFLQEHLNQHAYTDQLIEIVLDLGRRPEARFVTGPEYLSQKIISWQDIDYMTKRISKFSNENRAGIERTLHRISCIRNRQFLINGLTCRVGRAVFGTISVVRDLLESEKSILILGKPGVGKTTIIREIARVLADEMEKRVIIIDTSNEIAGDSDIPHSGIGRARRMQVAKTELQHQVMIEAVENHMPQVIIIDEIGTELEVLAARTIAEKGVQLVGTTHGNCLENLIKNPPLADLIGGIQYVTLSDDEAKRRGTQKSILERKAYPAFEIIIEINDQNSWTIHEDVKNSVDLFLRGGAKGLTWFAPEEDQMLLSRSQLLARIITSLGGRAAEQVVFGDPEITTGASSDLQQVTNIARQMVTRYGMSNIGPIALEDDNNEQMFLGGDSNEAIADRIDTEVCKIINHCEQIATEIILDNRVIIDLVVEKLLDAETIDGEEFRKIVSDYTLLPSKN